MPAQGCMKSRCAGERCGPFSGMSRGVHSSSDGLVTIHDNDILRLSEPGAWRPKWTEIINFICVYSTTLPFAFLLSVAMGVFCEAKVEFKEGRFFDGTGWSGLWQNFGWHEMWPFSVSISVLANLHFHFQALRHVCGLSGNDQKSARRSRALWCGIVFAFSLVFISQLFGRFLIYYYSEYLPEWMSAWGASP
jgi:hypothetical protein